MKWQNATITKRLMRSPRVVSLFFGMAQPFPFIPGQHVTVRLTAPDGYRAQRSYSLVSTPEDGEEGEIELAIEKFDDGEVSPFLHDVAEVGDDIEIGGPIGGYFNWVPADGAPVMLIAGGSGVAPFISMLRHRAAIGSRAEVTLVFSARDRMEFLFGDELSAMAVADEKFRLMVTLTREADAAPWRSGRIDNAFIASAFAAYDKPVSNVLICGSNGFVEAAVDGAMAAGVEAGLIKTERYGGA